MSKDATYHIDDEINANNMKVEEDSSELYTYAVGYGGYDDDDGIKGAGLIMKFEHPDMKTMVVMMRHQLRMVVSKMKK